MLLRVFPIQSILAQAGLFIWFGPYALLVRMLIFAVVLFSLSRLALIVWLSERVLATGQLWNVLLQGARADLIMICMWLLLPVFLAPVWATQRFARSWYKFTYYWSLLGLVFFIFMELATPSFIMQYDVRPNRLFVEYLKYPKEVFSTLWNGFRVPLIAGVLVTIALSLLAAAWLKKTVQNPREWSLGLRLITWPLVIILIVLGIRSSFGHRPANPAYFSITGDSLVNSLVINSSYSVAFSIYNLKHEARSSEIYGKLPMDKVIEQSLAWPWLQSYTFNNPDYPTVHFQQSVMKREKPLNLVIVLEESLGATFVESLGGVAVTPELEKLKHDGWWFEQLYSTGTRSVRGIEAVVAGFMPTPAQSVVKLSLSQKGFTTLGSVLSAQGFHTEFIYGGEAHFDNMRSFFTGNGFSQIIDINDIKNPVFVGSWGASDEDLFNHAHEHLTELHKQQKPFFSLIFSSTNHEPFEFPDGRISLHEEPKNRVNNAVKYADYALGQFFKQARQSDYWQDTVFLIVADHDNRVYGSNLVPVEKFHIPALILGADIQPETITPVASQIDLAPTLLSLMGISSHHPMIGRDFALDKTSSGRAPLQFNEYFVLLEDKAVAQDVNDMRGLTILRPSQSPLRAEYSATKKHLNILDAPPTAEQKEKALAHVLLPSYLYREQKYKVPKAPQ